MFTVIVLGIMNTMVRSEVGWCLVVVTLLACGESSKHSDSAQGGATGTGGMSGSSTAGGASGSSMTGAAGDAGEFAPYFLPGSRLKPRVLTWENGVDVLGGGAVDNDWYDTELEFDCIFLPDEAGIERCFPSEFVRENVYADAGCTRPVLVAGARASCDAPRYEYLIDDDGGDCGYRGFRIGAELPPSTPLFFSLDGSSCQEQSSAGDLSPIYELEPVPADTFVGMRRVQRERAPGLDAYVREGDDGSWQVIGFFDSAREAPCFKPSGGLSSSSQCIPPFVSSVGLFADSACERRTADGTLRACEMDQPTAMLHAREDTSACPTTYNFELYEIGDIRETTPYEVDDSGACVASVRPAAKSYVQGVPIDLSTLPVLERLVVGAGEVRALFTGFGDKPYLPIERGAGQLLDKSGSVCAPFKFPDGTLRCVSTSFFATRPSAFRYEDASCTGAPVVPWSTRPSCSTDPPLPPGVVIPDESQECPRELALTEAIAIVGKSTASTLYVKDSMTSACEPAEPISPSLTYLALGETLNATEFPEIERTLRQ